MANKIINGINYYYDFTASHDCIHHYLHCIMENQKIQSNDKKRILRTVLQSLQANIGRVCTTISQSTQNPKHLPKNIVVNIVVDVINMYKPCNN